MYVTLELVYFKRHIMALTYFLTRFLSVCVQSQRPFLCSLWKTKGSSLHPLQPPQRHSPKIRPYWRWTSSPMNPARRRRGRPAQQMHKRLLNRKKKRENIYFCMRYLYIYAIVHMCPIILYIRLFSYWKRLFIHSLLRRHVGPRNAVRF